MCPSQQTALKAGLAVLIVVVLALLVVREARGRGSYSVESVALSGWTLEASPPNDPALVALRPPPPLSTDLFQQLLRRSGQPLVAPAHPSVPLVLRGEYGDSLQGVLSVADLLDAARDAGVEAARFEPVCMGLRREPAPGRSGELFFVLFDAPAFDKFRDDLTPMFPEHAGAYPYEPKALSPILTIAATDREFAQWWPIALSGRTACTQKLRIRNEDSRIR